MHSNEPLLPGLPFNINSQHVQNNILMNTIETLENLKIHYEKNSNPSLQMKILGEVDLLHPAFTREIQDLVSVSDALASCM